MKPYIIKKVLHTKCLGYNKARTKVHYELTVLLDTGERKTLYRTDFITGHGSVVGLPTPYKPKVDIKE